MKYILLVLVFLNCNILGMSGKQLAERRQNRNIDCCQLASNLACIAKCCCLLLPYKAAEFTFAAGVKPIEVVNNYLKNKKDN